MLARGNSRLARNLKDAKLKQHCCVEDVDFERPRNLRRAQFMELAQCRWIKQGQNLILTGPTGSGKSFLACALADKACKLELKARYLKARELARNSLLLARTALIRASWRAWQRPICW